ncbi:hypothetical protein EYF80_012871 [Liparis tanakae]|uniref:Uncharacterized protein n=1 Tax=Liparis tanakae TaxID=230148 RepID=A0A4Z2IFU2_9TELE|nr:hypothetical protein EYF80_012871 [Liparis tanakae]
MAPAIRNVKAPRTSSPHTDHSRDMCPTATVAAAPEGRHKPSESRHDDEFIPTRRHSQLSLHSVTVAQCIIRGGVRSSSLWMDAQSGTRGGFVGVEQKRIQQESLGKYPA